MRVRASDLPSLANERELASRLLTREALLRRSAIVVDARGAAGPALDAFIDEVECPMVVVGDDAFATSRPRAVLEVFRPQPAEQRAIWRAELGDGAGLPDADLEQLTSHFHLTAADRFWRSGHYRFDPRSTTPSTRLVANRPPPPVDDALHQSGG